jgi:uncharacterized protein YebE (UPF0316 family)
MNGNFRVLVEMLATAGLAVGGVTLWTVRVAVTARGSRALAAALAATEAMLFIVAFSQLMSGFHSPHRVIAYGIGVAIGTILGLTLDRRLNPQLSRVDIVDPTGLVASAVEDDGWPFTRSTGHGSAGSVAVLSVVTPDTRVPDLLDLVTGTGASTFWTVAPVRRSNAVRVPGGHRQVVPMRQRLVEPTAPDQPGPHLRQAAAHV